MSDLLWLVTADHASKAAKRRNAYSVKADIVESYQRNAALGNRSLRA